MRIRVAVLATALLSAGAVARPDASLADLRFGDWGVDLTARDTTVTPGHDFDAYAGGEWSKRTEIAADSPYAGVSYDLRKLTDRRVDTLIASAPRGSPVGTLFADYMDEARVEAAGPAALRADLARIAGARDHDALAALLGERMGGFTAAPVDVDVGSDPDDGTRRMIVVRQPRLGLPNRDYYVLDRFAPVRAAYRTWIGDALRLSGTDAPGAADAVFAFEGALARGNWTEEARGDVTRTTNRATLAELEGRAPGLRFGVLLAAAGLPADPAQRILVAETSAIAAAAATYRDAPLATVKAWLAFRTVNAAAEYLPRAYGDARFPLVQAGTGVARQQPRRDRAIRTVSRLLGEPIGRAYVARYFDPRAKAAMGTLTENLRRAYRRRIATLDWLGPDSKREALAKLDRIEFMLGYPDTWRDYAALRMVSGNLYANAHRIGVFDWRRDAADFTRPVDRRRWYLTPQTVNAYYDRTTNQVVFPAARLQPPFFGLRHDAAANYGAIGAVIGHEISHGFDNAGRHYDAAGRLRDWWMPADAARFERRIAVLGRHYDMIEALPGVRINGRLTMGENIADLGGLLAAHDAYRLSLNGRPAPVIDGLTGDQRFFLAYAQARREKQRDADMRDQLSTGPHSPSRFRVIGTVRSVDAWYAAFGVGPGSRYYLPPAERARIW